MPSVVTVSWVPLKKDATPPNPEDYKDYPRPKGMVSGYHGKPADANEPPALELVNIWESVDAVNAAHNSPEGAKFRADIEAVTDTSNPELKIHINTFVFTNDYAPVADAAITEQTFMFVDPSVNQADFVAVWEEALKGWTSPPGWITGTYGWAEGEVDNPPQLGAGKSKVFLASAGWESLDKAKAGISVSKTAFEPLVTKFGLKPEQVHSRFTVLTKAP